MATAGGTKSRRWATAALLLLLLSAWGLRMRGIEWPLLHPDEYKISGWATWMEEHTRTANAAYPGGYFHLIKPILLAKNAVGDVQARWSEFEGHADGRARAGMEQTFFLRKINVGISLLTLLLLYGLARRITGSRPAALAATAFLAFSRLHVEHTHYAETDVAMLFMLTAGLYLWARVRDGGPRGWFWVAALVTGVAFGTKYTNAILLASAVAGIIYCVRVQGGGHRGRRLILYSLGGLMLILGGWFFTNRHILEWSDFWANVTRALHSAYGERTGILGESSGDPWAMVRSNWLTFAHGISEINAVWLAFLVAGVCLAVRPKYRRFWAVMWLPAGLYLFYFLKLAPWVRGQEFMVFLPFFGVLIAVAVHESLTLAQRMKHVWVSAAVVGVLLTTAILESALSAGRFDSLCGWPEPRIQAMKWLYCHAPLHTRVGIEEYTVPVCRLFDDAADIGQIERTSPDRVMAAKLDYLIRNKTSTGRGTVDPRTRNLYPDYAANLAHFERHAQLLCAWGPRDPTYAFVGNEMEWWDVNPEAPTLKLVTPLFRPSRIEDSFCICVPVNESGVGSAAGMFVDSKEREFVVSGVSAASRPLYVVLQTEERGGTVDVAGMGMHRTVVLAPYDVAVVPLKRPWFVPRNSEYDVISVRAEPQHHFDYLPCYAQVVMRAEDVEMLLYQKGYPDRALAWAAQTAIDSAGKEWLRYACAVDHGDWPLAARLEPAARQMLAQLELARTLSPERVLVNGCSGAAYRDHSRIRLPPLDTGMNGITETLVPMSLHLQKEEGAKKFTCEAILPVRLAPGRYTLHGTLKSKPPVILTRPWTLTVGDSRQGGVVPVTIEPGKPCEFVFSITVERERSLTVVFASDEADGFLEMSDVEIRWDVNDLFWPERRALYHALVNHAAHRSDMELARHFLREAADSIRDVEGWTPREQESGVTGAVKDGPVFYPWVKLAAVEQRSKNSCRVSFVVLKDAPPPLKVMVYQKKGKGWRHVFEANLSVPSRAAGEVVPVDIPLSPDVRLSDLSVRVISSLEWVSTPLHVDGASDGRVRLRN